MPEMTFQVLPTGAALGAEIRGLDLRRRLSPQTVRELRAAFLNHCVLLFRDQQISEADHVRFTGYFGTPQPHVREQPDRPVEEIFVISNIEQDGKPIGALGYDEIRFHSDLSYMQDSGAISILFAVEVTEAGGDTMWANCYAGYEALDDALKAHIAGLKAIHRHPREQQNPPVPAVHPLVRTHPETGRPVLYVSPDFIRHIDGFNEAESAKLIERLIAHATQSRFVWKHHWQPGDLVMWDNRCTMHRREPFDNRERRVMKRTQLFMSSVRS
jgi:taurine dioxygenase